MLALNDWAKALDENKQMGAVNFDFSKAFYRVYTAKLNAKLGQLGILSKLVEWIRDLLSNRTCQIRVGSEFFSIHGTFSGVPPGRVLSPLLFLSYTFDLSASVQPMEGLHYVR